MYAQRYERLWLGSGTAIKVVGDVNWAGLGCEICGMCRELYDSQGMDSTDAAGRDCVR